MENQENNPVVASLALSAEHGASAEQIADAVVAAWEQIDDSLSPILGRGGVAALHARARFLTSKHYPCVSCPLIDVGEDMDLANLKMLLAQQGNAEAAAAGGALLQTFHTLLTSMVGPTLTERLLRTVWETLLSGRPAQDCTP